MTQIVCAGEPGITGNALLTPKKTRRVFTPVDQLLALAVAVGLHAAILPWLLTAPPAVPPVSVPQALPMEIEFAGPQPVAVEAPPPAVVSEPVVEPPPAPPEVDENALAAAKPKVRPETKAKPKPVKKRAVPKPKPQPAAAVANKPLHAAVAPENPAPPVTSVTPPLANANYLHNPAPEYPESAINRGLEGTVLLKVQVSPAGKVTEIQIYKSSGVSALDEAALGTVRRWSFVPAKRGSEAVSGQVIVPIDFSLNS